MKPISKKTRRSLDKETALARVLRVFYIYPDKEFSLSELAKESKVAKANIGAILKNLSSFGIIKINYLTNIWRIQANTESWEFKKRKIGNNLYTIYDSSIIEFLINLFKNPRAIVLIGSYRKGEDITDSDIDIAIESQEIKETTSLGLYEFVRSKEEKKLIEEFERIIRRKIQIHLFNKDTVDSNLFKNIANGIVLWGFLEVKAWKEK